MKRTALYALSDNSAQQYLTVRELKEQLNQLDNEDGIVLISNGNTFYVIDEIELDSDQDLLIRANTEYD